MPELSTQARQETVAASERASGRTSEQANDLQLVISGRRFFFPPPEPLHALGSEATGREGGTQSKGSREAPRGKDKQILRSGDQVGGANGVDRMKVQISWTSKTS